MDQEMFEHMINKIIILSKESEKYRITVEHQLRVNRELKEMMDNDR